MLAVLQTELLGEEEWGGGKERGKGDEIGKRGGVRGKEGMEGGREGWKERGRERLERERNGGIEYSLKIIITRHIPRFPQISTYHLISRASHTYKHIYIVRTLLYIQYYNIQ